MSRNFELLSRLGDQYSLFRAQSAVAEPCASAPACTKAEARHETASAEEIALVQRVFLPAGANAPRAVVFCGIEERNGSASLSARASEILAARMMGSVCLIDADLRSPSLHKRYGVENHTGLTDAAFERGVAKGFAQQADTEGNLWLLPAGSRTGEHGVLALDRFRERIAELREQFNYLLISAPPVNLYSDAIMYGQLCDGIILVLKANSTRRVTALKVKETLEASNVRLLGAVLSERTYPVPGALYRNF